MRPPGGRAVAQLPLRADAVSMHSTTGRRTLALLRLSAAILPVLLALLACAGARAAGRSRLRVRPPGGVFAPSPHAATILPWAQAPALTGARPLGGAPAPGAATPGPSGTSPGGGTPPLLYGGGPVMHAVTTEVVAWAPAGYAFPNGYVAGFEQYLSDLAASRGQSGNVTSLAAQYVDASGPALSSLANAAPISDTTPYPASGCTVAGASACLTTAQLVTELANVITAGALPSDLQHSYIVLLPPGVDSCYDSSSTTCETQAFCGYHLAFAPAGAGYTSFTLVPYTESSYSNSAGVCYSSQGPSSVSTAVMALDNIGTHELLEAATDPMGGSGYIDSSGFEIADECAWTWGPLSAATGGGYYNQLLAGDQYLVQEMWSDQGGACAQGTASTASAAIAAGGSPTAGLPAALGATLSGAGSAATAYAWSYLAPDGSVSQDVATGADPQVTFPSAGTYTVWVTVTDAGGGTIFGVTRLAVTSAPPPAAAFTYTPQTTDPTASSPITFDSSATAGGSESITAASWSFGDGSSAAGNSVTHAYAAAGTYTVTLTVSQTDGQQSSVRQAITVLAAPSPAVTGQTITQASTQTSAQTTTQTSAQTPSATASTTAARAGLARKNAEHWLAAAVRASARLLWSGRRLAHRPVSVRLARSGASGWAGIRWYVTIRRQRVLVAVGAVRVRHGLTPRMALRLTPAGRLLLLRRGGRLRLHALATFRAPGLKASLSGWLTLSRRRPPAQR